MKRSGLILVLSLCLPAILFAQECNLTAATSATELATAAGQTCCARQNTARCIKKARNAIKRAKGILSPGVANAARESLSDILSSSCDLTGASIVQCTNALATTVVEANDNIDEKACSLKSSSQRIARLKKFRRALNKLKSYDLAFVNAVKADIKSLMNSKSCGTGGSNSGSGAVSGSCGGTESLRDGPNGNVYKRTDHGCGPVLVTHNGARSASAFTTSCQKIDNWNYTGLANRDPKGLRHHYRGTKCCSSYPNRFILKVGSKNYLIDKNCGRID